METAAVGPRASVHPLPCARSALFKCRRRPQIRVRCSTHGSDCDPSVSLRDEQPPKQPSNPSPDNVPYDLVTAISSVGFAGTGYLTWSKVTQTSVACPVTGSCSNVLDSSYAQVLGVPLSFFGMLAYGALAALAVYSASVSAGRASSESPLTLSTARSLMLTCSSLMLGVSGTLIAVLLTKFPGTTCIYCLGSAAASFSLFGLIYAGLPSQQRQSSGKYSFGGMLATATILGALYATYPEPTIARMQNLVYQAPVITSESVPGAKDLAIRLRDAGAKFYGAFWCSHCYEQKEMFGKDAADELPYVECYPKGIGAGQTLEQVCKDADIQGFPTWVINGKKVEGDWPLGYLEAVLDGADPVEARSMLF